MKLRCTVCRTYVEKDEAIRVGVVSFCSEACQGAARQIRKKQGAARTTTQGRRRERGVPEGLRAEVVAADGGRCRYCGGTSFLHAHHALYRSEGGKHVRENLIMLCDEHHALVHSDKKRFQPLVLRVIMERELSGDMLLTIPMLEGR